MQNYQSRQASNGWPNQVLVEERPRVEEIESYLANVAEEYSKRPKIPLNRGPESGSPKI